MAAEDEGGPGWAGKYRFVQRAPPAAKSCCRLGRAMASGDNPCGAVSFGEVGERNDRRHDLGDVRRWAFHRVPVQVLTSEPGARRAQRYLHWRWYVVGPKPAGDSVAESRLFYDVGDFGYASVELFEMNGPSDWLVPGMTVIGVGTYCGAGVDDCSGLGCGQ